jgi:hypothetical protein
MQNNEPMFVEQPSPSSDPLVLEDQFPWNEVVARDTWSLGFDIDLNYGSSRAHPDIRPLCLCSHDRSLSAMDLNAYHPSALDLQAGKPSFSGHEPYIIPTLHENGMFAFVIDLLTKASNTW